MNSQKLTTLKKEIYQQPMLKVITIQTSRSILEGSYTEFEFGGDQIQ